MSSPYLSSVEKVISVLEQLVPGLVGQVTDQRNGQIVVGSSNKLKLQSLLQNIQQQHPEAGTNYAVVRTWCLVTWQPIILLLIAFFVTRKHICLHSLGQDYSDTSVFGYSISADCLSNDCRDAELFDLSARNLKSYCDAFKQDLLEAGGEIKTLEANRLLADQVLSMLMLIRKQFLPVDTAEFISLCERWLEAMGLKDHSAVMRFQSLDGTEQLALNRKGCCLHYRRADGEYCCTCPRQTLSVRVKRLQQEF